MDDEWIDIDPQTRYERFYEKVINVEHIKTGAFFVMFFGGLFMVLGLFRLDKDCTLFFGGTTFLVLGSWLYERSVAKRVLLRMQEKIKTYQEAEKSKAALRTGG